MLSREMKPSTMPRFPERAPLRDFVGPGEIIGTSAPLFIWPVHELVVSNLPTNPWIRRLHLCNILLPSISRPLDACFGVIRAGKSHQRKITFLIVLRGFPRQVNGPVFGQCRAAGIPLPESITQPHEILHILPSCRWPAQTRNDLGVIKLNRVPDRWGNRQDHVVARLL